MIRFMKHYVTNGTAKVRCTYSAFRMTTTGKLCVTLYAKDYSHDLARVLPDLPYENDTDICTDYFDHGKIRILEGHPLYAAALARCAS